MTTIRVVPDMDLNKDGKVSLGELVFSGFVIFAGLFSLLLLLAGTVWILFFTDAVAGVKVIAGALFLSSAIAVVVVLYRMFRYERGEKRDNLEWALEREKKEWELGQIKGVVEQEGDTAWNQATQDLMARKYLFWSYQQGHIITREEWKKRGESEVAWNRLNKLMKQYHIRSHRSQELQHGDFAEAWGAWCDAMMKSRSWVRSGEEFIKD